MKDKTMSTKAYDRALDFMPDAQAHQKPARVTIANVLGGIRDGLRALRHYEARRAAGLSEQAAVREAAEICLGNR